jgi:hypothetical protein
MIEVLVYLNLILTHFLDHYIEQKIANDMWNTNSSKKTQFQASNLHSCHQDQTPWLRNILSKLNSWIIYLMKVATNTSKFFFLVTKTLCWFGFSWGISLIFIKATKRTTTMTQNFQWERQEDKEGVKAQSSKPQK